MCSITAATVASPTRELTSHGVIGDPPEKTVRMPYPLVRFSRCMFPVLLVLGILLALAFAAPVWAQSSRGLSISAQPGLSDSLQADGQQESRDQLVKRGMRMNADGDYEGAQALWKLLRERDPADPAPHRRDSPFDSLWAFLSAS